MTDAKSYYVGQDYWLDPAKYPPPQGVKIQLLTNGGISVYGQWDPDSYVAWGPLLRTTPEIKELLLEAYKR